MQRCKATVNFLESEKPFIPPTINDIDLHQHFQKVAGDLLGSSSVKDHKPMMAGDDFAFYQEVMPGYIYGLGLKDEAADGKAASEHSPYFKVNEDAFCYGAALQASLAARYVLEHPPEVPSPRVTSNHDEL